MASTYNPYDDIQKVYNAKVNWNKATTDEERKRQNEIATAARKNLEAYGYSDVANQISASGADATAARKILEQYAPTAPDSTSLTNNELITTNNNETRNKINQLWGTQTSDRETMAGKYNKLEDTAYSNPFETDEAKAILGKYDLAALQGRNNAVASGGASNGGNIDSYAAANALRQQSALVNQGQMAVLDAHNNKINNVKGILESLGVYQQNQDKGMQNTITLQSNEGQRLFENEETAKNNDVARKSEIASVSGYTPDEWIASSNPYMNDDGTIKDEYKNVDFSEVMAKAKAAGNTNAYNAAAVARYYKIMGNYGLYGQYDDGNYAVPGQQQTEAGRQFDKQDALARETLKSEENINSSNNQNAIDQINAQTQGQKEIIEETSKYGNVKVDKNGNVTVQDENDLFVGGDDEWETFKEYFSDKNVSKFLDEKLKPYFDNGWEINEEVLEKLIVGTDVLNSNSTTYDIDVEEARAICDALGLDSSWVDKYKNRTWFNKGKGMKSSE